MEKLIITCPSRELNIKVTKKLVKDGYKYFNTSSFLEGRNWGEHNNSISVSGIRGGGHCNLKYYQNNPLYVNYKFLTADEYLGIKKLTIIKSTIMNKITAKIKRIFNKDFQAQYKAGIIDDKGDLTSDGKIELDELIRTDYEEKLTIRAKEIIKEEKENK